MTCQMCGARILEGRVSCSQCGAMVGRAPGMTVAAPNASAGLDTVRVCPRCGFHGTSVSYFATGAHIVVLMALAVFTSGIGALIYLLLRGGERICPQCGLKWGRGGYLAPVAPQGSRNELGPELASLSAEAFVHDVLTGRLHATAVVVGADFRFGARAGGDVALLERLGSDLGFTVDAVPLTGDGERWSSTRIRAMVAAGDVAVAAAALGRLHRVEGPVVRGDQRGRTIGYPTANLALEQDAAIPADGIYAGWLTCTEGRLPAAISIGTNPTFGGTVRRVEAYVLDRDDLELYGEHVAVDFVERLRDTLTFDGVEPLVAQMRRDVDRARILLLPPA